MKRNLIISAAFSSLMLLAVSCDTKKNTADYVTDENFKVYTDTTYPQQPVDLVDSISEANSRKRLSYALNGPRVELLLDNVLIKVLEFNYTPSAENISVADFNFDSYDDIFIPYESPPDYGTYFCYDPEKNSFVENNELNAIGRITKVTDEGIITEDRSDDLTQRYIEYQWTNGKLKAFKKTETFKSAENGEIITNIYSYDEKGNEYLSG